jgi:hypothetical protein
MILDLKNWELNVHMQNLCSSEQTSLVRYGIERFLYSF